MRIILSPAKKMNIDTESLAPDELPQFLKETEKLKTVLQSKQDKELQALWNCSESLARFNVERLHTMDLYRILTPAILAYEGLQFQYMAPNVFEDAHFAYIREHLRILSGFYGILRPFDGVTPYRLEMQSRLSVDGYKNLYAFWGSKLADQLATETDCILNLASKEYSKAVAMHLPPTIRMITCTFGERKNGKVVEKGTMCKMARGQMVRWMAEQNITKPEDIKAFTELGYRYSDVDSKDDNLVFLEGGS